MYMGNFQRWLTYMYYYYFTLSHEIHIDIQIHLSREEFEGTKGVIILRKSKDRQHNGQKKKEKRTNNDLQNITYKTKY
jgi:hypothetical protein